MLSDTVARLFCQFFFEKSTGTRAGKTRKVNSCIGEFEITTKQAKKLKLEKRRRTSYNLEQNCILLASNESFAKEVGASQDKIILLVEDGAGWHRRVRVELPSGIVTEILPAYSPELQEAERLWSLVDEPLINTYFDNLDKLEEILIERCCYLQDEMAEEIRNLTNFHWLKYS